jgi:hypothetical protein
MEIKMTTKNQDFHVVLVKRGNFNERQSTKKTLERGSSMLFSDNNETIQHLFFDCHVAMFVWTIFTVAFGLQPPKDITDLCGVWLN